MICPNCGASVYGKRCEYCGTWFVTEPEREEPRRETPAEKEKEVPLQPQPAEEKGNERTLVFSRECGQQTGNKSSVDDFTFYQGILLFLFLCLAGALVGLLIRNELLTMLPMAFFLICLPLFIACCPAVETIQASCAKVCDAETLWNSYRTSPVKARGLYHNQWLDLKIRFSGFLNDPADGSLVAGCASFYDGGTELKLVFIQTKGKEHLVPGREIRVLGKCKGIQAGRLTLEDCFVLTVSEFAAEPEREKPLPTAPAEKEKEVFRQTRSAAGNGKERTLVFSRECGQQTDVAFPEDPIRSGGGGDSLLFFFLAYLFSAFFGAAVGGTMAAVGLSVLFLLWGVSWMIENDANYEENCDAEALWNFYQDSPADAEKRYHDQWLGLTVYFSGFWNDPADGSLVAGCASFHQDGTEFELVFFRKKGKEHLIPGQSIRILGRCKGLREGRLRLESCSVLEVFDPSKKPGSKAQARNKGDAAPSEGSLKTGKRIESLAILFLILSAFLSLNALKDEIWALIGLGGFFLSFLLFFGADVQGSVGGAGHEKICDAEMLWNFYRVSSADAERQYQERRLNLTVYFSGFLNIPTDGPLIVGCASFYRGGTEFELVFSRQEGQEYPLPGQLVRIAGTCKGLREGRLRLESCSVLEVFDPSKKPGSKAQARKKGDAAPSEGSLKTGKRIESLATLFLILSAFLSLNALKDEIWALIGLGGFFLSFLLFFGADVQGPVGGAGHEKICDAEMLWNFYRVSSADAERQYQERRLNLTVYFSGFLNIPTDGPLIVGCASFYRGGTEFELVFSRQEGQEYPLPGQLVRIVGTCKGLREGRLRLEECSVLKVLER